MKKAQLAEPCGFVAEGRPRWHNPWLDKRKGPTAELEERSLGLVEEVR